MTEHLSSTGATEPTVEPAAVPPLLDRRRALGLMGAGLVLLAGCGSSSDSASDTSTSSTGAGGSSSTTAASSGSSSTSGTDASTTTSAAGTCSPIPQETAGPFPADGSNGPNILIEDGVVRSDIRSSIGSASGTADGIELEVDLTVVDTAAGCAPLAGAAVYAWHCDREGRYSMYSDGAEDENYLRGVQVADADGRLRFTTTSPGAYEGRWPHIHFEVFRTVDDATDGSNAITTSQLALPVEVCQAVYATDGYDDSVGNLAATSLDRDMVFSDGHDLQMAAVTGDVDAGYAAQLTVGV
jgi:protocatechuate 3,4-dioxygenase beta subunit